MIRRKIILPRQIGTLRVKNTILDILSKTRNAYKREGLYYVLRTSSLIVLSYFAGYYYKLFKSSETFEFQGGIYHYLFHKYCTTWRNERTVLIPIIWEIVKKYKEQNKMVLEVGNVLSYYFDVDHDILDKYEIKDGVINEDVVDFKPSKYYDLIVTIVTLELVGWSENEALRDPMKILAAIENLKSHVSHGGKIVAAICLGFNTELDNLIRNKSLQFNKASYLKKISNYKWHEVDWEDVKDVKYDHYIPSANAVLVGTILIK
jgi:hypothetical protein